MKKILIAEDNNLYRETLKNLLSDYQIVGETGNGSAVMQLVEKNSPDLILLDLSLPNMSGIEVARQVKKTFPRIKVLVISIHDSADYINEALDVGVDGYCFKDEDRKTILKTVEGVLEGRKYSSPHTYGSDQKRLRRGSSRMPQKRPASAIQRKPA